MLNITAPSGKYSLIVVSYDGNVKSGVLGFLVTVIVTVAVATKPGDKLSKAVTTN